MSSVSERLKNLAERMDKNDFCLDMIDEVRSIQSLAEHTEALTVLEALRQKVEEERESLQRDRKHYRDIDQRFATDQWVEALKWVEKEIKKIIATTQSAKGEATTG
jgi:hypothetical protein